MSCEPSKGRLKFFAAREEEAVSRTPLITPHHTQRDTLIHTHTHSMDIDDNILTSNATASSFDAFNSTAASSSSAAAAAASLTELSELSVRFVTRNENLPRVPDTYLSVPAKLARYGLSEIVNALTNTGQQQQTHTAHTTHTTVEKQRAATGTNSHRISMACRV